MSFHEAGISGRHCRNTLIRTHHDEGGTRRFHEYIIQGILPLNEIGRLRSLASGNGDRIIPSQLGLVSIEHGERWEVLEETSPTDSFATVLIDVIEFSGLMRRADLDLWDLPEEVAEEAEIDDLDEDSDSPSPF